MVGILVGGLVTAEIASFGDDRTSENDNYTGDNIPGLTNEV